AVHHPGVCLRHRADRCVRRWVEVAPGDRERPGRLVLPHPAPLPDPAGDPARAHPVRIHRAHGQGGHDRGARLRLRPDGDAQGAAALRGDPAPRPAQLAAPDHHGHRHPDRLPDRGPASGRDAVQLPRSRSADRHGRHRQGLSDARRGCPGHRRRLPGGDPHRRRPVLRPDPADPTPGSRMMADDELPDAPAVTAGTRTPLEDDPALRDPAAALVVAPAAEGGAAGAVDVSARQIRREYLRLLLRSPAFDIGVVILLWWVVCAVFGRVIAPYNPVAGSLLQFNQPPSSAHWFGTDSLGRDVFSRVIVGARDIRVISALATVLGTAVGTSIGLVQGYFRGVVDNVVGRLVDALLSLPVVIVVFLFVVAVGASTITLILVIGLVFAVIIARTVRTAVLQERELDYVA